MSAGRCASSRVCLLALCSLLLFALQPLLPVDVPLRVAFQLHLQATAAQLAQFQLLLLQIQLAICQLQLVQRQNRLVALRWQQLQFVQGRGQLLQLQLSLANLSLPPISSRPWLMRSGRCGLQQWRVMGQRQLLQLQLTLQTEWLQPELAVCRQLFFAARFAAALKRARCPGLSSN